MRPEVVASEMFCHPIVGFASRRILGVKAIKLARSLPYVDLA